MKEAMLSIKKYLKERILTKTPNRKNLLFQDYMEISI